MRLNERRRIRLATFATLTFLAGAPIDASIAEQPSATDTSAAQSAARERFERDLDAMRTYRPGYRFWTHVFTVPDGSIAFGSAGDGRLLATFPARGDWARAGSWEERSLAELFADRPLEGRLDQRREDAARLLQQVAGPVVHHATRGSFIGFGTERYGTFLTEWGVIFERFGVPAELGLAQALVESGLRGRIRSEAGAMGLCQWLPVNWTRLKRLSQHVIEADNQTTQAPYCAAHLAILGAKYGSFIPALSEHHAGGVNVGRTIINGAFSGGEDVRARYFLGAELTLLIRQIGLPGYREVAGGYGPRSFRYAELVFGNMATIASHEAAIPQQRIFAMRPSRAVALEEVTRRTGLSVDEVRRFNPALINRVPAGANVYLPSHVSDFGADTAFWHRPPSPEYAAALAEFVRLEERYTPEEWLDQSVVETLRAFEARFRATGSEEGVIMAVMIAYVIEELVQGDPLRILAEFRSSERVVGLLEQGIRELQTRFPASDDGDGWARRSALLSVLNLGMR